jgi:hypothetical protein
MRDRARFPLAERLRGEGITLGEAFSFLSGLYFRGKLAYATRFGRSGLAESSALVITTNRGLMGTDATIGLADLRAFGAVDIDAGDPRYREPLQRDAAGLAADPRTEIVLLGSVATGKYVDVLLDALGERLLFPSEFVGRGDMSRGALLLRAAGDGVELDYQPVQSALRRGHRAPKVSAP